MTQIHTDAGLWCPEQCTRGCFRIDECEHPGRCFTPAESATEIGAEPGVVRSMRHYTSARDALRALGIVAAIALAVIIAAHLGARMGWLQ